MSLQTPIIIRSGKATTGFDSSAAEWEINASGWMDQLRTVVPAGRFRANLKGFSLNRYTPLASSDFDDIGVYQQPHMYIREIVYTSGTAFNEYAYYDTVEDLRQAALDVIQAQTDWQCSYSLSDSGDLVFLSDSGDLVFTPNDSTTYPYSSVRMAGVVPWILGWGNVFEDQIQEISDDVTSTFQLFTRDRGQEDAEDQYIWDSTTNSVTRGTSEGNPNIRYWIFLTNTEDSNIYDLRLSPLSTGVEFPSGSGEKWIANFFTANTAKNPCRAKYFYQWDYNGYTKAWVDTRHWVIPYDEAGTTRKLNLTFDSNVGLISSGQFLSIGRPGNNREFIGDVTGTSGSVGGAQSIEFNFTDSDGTLHPDSINSGRYNLFWATALEERDPYKVRDAGRPNTQKPSDIIKTLLGWRSASALDEIAPRRRVTTVRHLFGEDNNKDRTLVDWDAFDQYAEASSVEKAYYTLDLDDESLDLTIYEIWWNLCITLGIRMCYEYRESERAKVLTFRPFGGESASQIASQNKFVEQSELRVDETPRGTIGGHWLYSAVKPEIYDENGSQVPIEVNVKQGANTAPVYEYEDIMTVLEAPANAGDIPQNFINNLYEYAQKWAQPTWTQNLAATFSPYAILSVGAGCIYSAEWLLDRFTGAVGVTNRVGDLISLEEVWGRSGCQMSLDVQITQRLRKGWTPSVDINAVDISFLTDTLTILPGGFNTNPAFNVYSEPVNLVDQAYFGCWAWNKGTNAIEKRNCGCGDYRIVIFENETSTLTDSGASRNVWYGDFAQPTSTNLSAGTGTIVLDDATNFSTVLAALVSSAGSFGVDFIDSDDSGLQSCQSDFYGYLGDSSGKVDLTGGEVIRAIEWD
jgi:hypothetical protein